MTFRAKVYYEDTDAGGIVYHANYLKFAERARTEFLKEKGLSNQFFLAQGIGVVACHVEIDYYAPAVLEDELEIETRVLEIGKTSLSVEQEIFKDKIKTTRILIKLVFVNKETLRPVRVPELIQEKLKQEE